MSEARRAEAGWILCEKKKAESRPHDYVQLYNSSEALHHVSVMFIIDEY